MDWSLILVAACVLLLVLLFVAWRIKVISTETLHILASLATIVGFMIVIIPYLPLDLTPIDPPPTIEPPPDDVTPEPTAAPTEEAPSPTPTAEVIATPAPTKEPVTPTPAPSPTSQAAELVVNTPPPTPTNTPTPCVEPSVPYFAASPPSIQPGEETVLSWGHVNNAESVAIDYGNGRQGVGLSGELKVPLQRTTMIKLYAGYCGGQEKLLKEVPVEVSTPDPYSTTADDVYSGIKSPRSGDSVSGDVTILGTAIVDSFQKYELHYKMEPSGDDAYIYFFGSITPVMNGQLGIWQAGGLPAGLYTLRLRVVKTNGNYTEYYTQVRVD